MINFNAKLFNYLFKKVILYYFRLKDESNYIETSHILDEDFTVVRALTPSETYEFIVVSVDGEYLTESEPEEIEMSGK